MSDQVRRLSIHRTTSFRRRRGIPPAPTTIRHRTPPHLLRRNAPTWIPPPPDHEGFIQTEQEDGTMISPPAPPPPSSAAPVFAVREFPEGIGAFLEAAEQERIDPQRIDSLFERIELQTIDSLFEPRFSEDEIARAITVRLSDAAEGDDAMCVVCQDNLAGEDDRTVGMLHCRHEFHNCCIREWLRRKNVCPLCKVPASQDRSPA